MDAKWPDSELFGYEPADDELKSISEAAELARRSDVAVVVLGGGLRTCGENRSRTSLDRADRKVPGRPCRKIPRRGGGGLKVHTFAEELRKQN